MKSFTKLGLAVALLLMLVGCNSEADKQRAHERSMACIQSQHCNNGVYNQGYNQNNNGYNQNQNNGYIGDTQDYQDDYQDESLQDDYQGDNSMRNGLMAGAAGGYLGSKVFNGKQAPKGMVFDKKGKIIPMKEAQNRYKQSQASKVGADGKPVKKAGILKRTGQKIGNVKNGMKEKISAANAKRKAKKAAKKARKLAAKKAKKAKQAKKNQKRNY